MPNKTIYVSDADLPIFERAQQLAGGNLSATIAQALRRFVESQEAQTGGLHEVTVKVGSVAYVQKRFVGRLLAKGRVEGDERERQHYNEPDDEHWASTSVSQWWQRTGRRYVFEIYETAKGKIALYTRDTPNWYTGGKRDYDEYEWNDRRGEYHLDVFETLDELRGRIPDELYQAAEQALKGESVEFLDI
jgi:EXLDI family protein